MTTGYQRGLSEVKFDEKNDSEVKNIKKWALALPPELRRGPDRAYKSPN